MGDTPILVMAVVFAALAVLDWTRLALCARVSLGVAAVFAIAAYRFPGMSAGEISEQTQDGLAYLVVVSRGAAVAVFMVSVASLIREYASR
jgi:hypothetical protein